MQGVGYGALKGSLFYLKQLCSKEYISGRVLKCFNESALGYALFNFSMYPFRASLNCSIKWEYVLYQLCKVVWFDQLK